MAWPISYLISATEIKPRSAPVDYTLTMHAAYWRRHTAPLGLPTALDVGKEEELEDFGCFFDRAGVGRTSISGPYHPDNPVENMANCGWCRGFAGVRAMERERCRDLAKNTPETGGMHVHKQRPPPSSFSGFGVSLLIMRATGSV